MRIAMPCLANSQNILNGYGERYVLRMESDGCYLCVSDANQSIKSIESPENAWTFHTHDGAVTHALWIGEVHGETPDVVKISR